jgi:acyl-CoA thioester hydrolase
LLPGGTGNKFTLSVAGLAEDGSRWIIRNEFFRPDGKLAARVTSAGGWLDLSARKLVAAPAGLLATMKELSRSGDFQELPSNIRQQPQALR